ncbi:hypothetical protein P3T73_06325 [Kiritimatiellota bacterium B12222]|nr:hypothetical protein P3T73_06325 [Kiritimatiellota bacterium B12222]
MKINKLLLTGIISTVALWQSAQAYTPPTDSQLNKMLANPKLITQILGDADGKEAATLVQRIFSSIQATKIGDAQKNYLIAFYSGRVASLLNSEQADVYAKQLVAESSAELLPIVFAGLATGRGGSSEFVSLLNALAGENNDLLVAIHTPNIPLTDPIYRLLTSTLSNVQSIPPSPIDSIPPPMPAPGPGPAPAPGPGPAPAPGPVPPAPPIPAPYNGQG